MNQDQLELFPAAPGTKRSGGRRVSKRAQRAAQVGTLIQQAQARGCTHVEISTDGVMFVLPSLVGRATESTYVRLDSPSLREALLQKRL